MMESFGGYEVVGRVAEGSTGVVYQARHVDLGRVAAIKVLSPDLRAVPGQLERMRAEAALLASLESPHIVEVYDFVEEADLVWIAEQWVEGASLEQILDTHGRLTPEQSLGAVRGALLGLAYAHERDLLHRDFSTGNVLADLAGTSMLVDFGLAAPVGSSQALGTPAFISPEVVRGEPADKRSDVYSAAAVTYTLLTGQPPFPATDVPAMLRAHLETAAPLLPGFGSDLQDLLHRAMDKDPGGRPPDAAAFLAELETAARRRFGAAWLERASIAGIVGSVVGAGAVAAGSLGAGAAGVAAAPIAETVVVDTGTLAGTGTDGGGAGAGATVQAAGKVAAKVARKSRGLIITGAAAATLLVVTGAAIAVNQAGKTKPATTPAKAAGVGAPTPTATTAPEPTLDQTVPRGVYRVTIRVTATNNPQDKVGAVVKRKWTFPTGSCQETQCAGVVSSSSGAELPFAYDGTSLQLSIAPDKQTGPCVYVDSGKEAPGTLYQTTSTYKYSPFRFSSVPSAGGPPQGFRGSYTVRQRNKVLRGDSCKADPPTRTTAEVVGVLIKP